MTSTCPLLMLIAPHFVLCACGTRAGQKFPLVLCRPVQGFFAFFRIIVKSTCKKRSTFSFFFLGVLVSFSSVFVRGTSRGDVRWIQVSQMFYSELQKGGSATWNCGKINSGNLKITHGRCEPKGMAQPNNKNNCNKKKKECIRHRFSFKLKQPVPERLHALHDLLTFEYFS